MCETVSLQKKPSGARDELDDEGNSHWRVLDGNQPGPCQPNSLAWSADNLLALACSTMLHIFDTSSSQPRWSVHTEQLQQESLLASELRSRSDRPQKSDARLIHPGHFFRTVCWSPLLQREGRTECLLCVAAGRACSILARPSSPYQTAWQPVVHLSRLLNESSNAVAGAGERK